MMNRRSPFALLLFAALALRSSGQEQPTRPATTTRVYYAAIVRKGPNWTPEQTPEIVRLGQEHRQYLETLLTRGVLVLAGPFTDNGDIRGIYLFKVDSEIEAKKLCDAAPFIKSGRLVVDIHRWQTAKEILTRD
jgi:uncharacterized protein YciI